MRFSIVNAQRSESVQQEQGVSSRVIRSSSPPPSPPSARKPRISLAPLEGWLPLVLLTIALYCVVMAIISVQWVSRSDLLYWSPGIGLVLGLLVAKTQRILQSLLHLGACFIGYWFALWLTCSVAFHVPWSAFFISLHIVLVGGVAPDALPVNEIAFFFYLNFLCFFLGYFGCWLVYRVQMPWLVALVYFSIMLVNLNYVKYDPSYLVVVMAAVLLLLVARMHLASQLMQWTDEGLYTNLSWRRSLIWRCMQVACLLSLMVVLCSWVLPVQPQPAFGANMWNSFDNAIVNATNGQFSLDNPTALFQPYQVPSNFFGDQLTISGRVLLPQGEVLNYTSSAGPHYLEGYTYNHFDGHSWTSVPARARGRDYGADTLLPVDETNGNFSTIKTRINVIQPPGGTRHYIFAPAQPVSFNVATTVYGDVTADAWVQQSPLVTGETYSVTSLAPPANTNTMNAIPLPRDMMLLWQQDENYLSLLPNDLQLPRDLSLHVRQTVVQWTRGAHDAYSALKRIESHLKDADTFSYSIDNPPVPSNIDAVDWLLQTRQGYCTYYATAMAVMGRMLAIPTRVVNGFSQGTLDKQHNRWSVSGSDAHSWVQAYLPGFGWASFDPTPGFTMNAISGQGVPAPVATPPAPGQTPVATLPVTQSPTPVGMHSSAPHLNAGSSPRHATGSAGSSWPPIVLSIVGIILVCGVCIVLAFRRWWRNLYRGQSFVVDRFWRLSRIAGWVGLAPRKWQTPYEYGEMLSRHFPQQAFPLWRLTDLFVRERWGAPAQAPLPEEKHYVAQSWPTLSATLLRCRWKRKK